MAAMRQQAENALAALGHWTIEIIKRSDAIKGFKLLPRRWVVRTHHRLAEPQSSPRKGFRGHNRERRNVADNRQRQAALTQARQSMIASRQIYESDSYTVSLKTVNDLIIPESFQAMEQFVEDCKFVRIDPARLLHVCACF